MIKKLTVALIERLRGEILGYRSQRSLVCGGEYRHNYFRTNP